MSKVWAISSGCDWSDASCYHLVIPDGVDVEAEHKNRRTWYNNVYLPSLRNRGGSGDVVYKSFVDWLMDRGATEPTEDQLREFYED